MTMQLRPMIVFAMRSIGRPEKTKKEKRRDCGLIEETTMQGLARRPEQRQTRETTEKN